MVTIGSRGPYEWLVTDESFDPLQLCPEIVVGKYVAVTSIDSSEFVPTEKFKPDRAGIEFLPKAKQVIEAAGFSLETEVFAESYDN
jgi:hypothetical protein